MQTVTLNNGVEMPIIGFGVFQIPDDETENAVTDAIDVGYRLIDTAASYQNEEAVGRGIAASGVPREELFITTKLWIQNDEESTVRSFENSLKRLGIDYLDLYLIHQPFGNYYAEWRAMEKLYEEGRVRAIGVSNFASDRYVDLILHNKVVPAINQIETNPLKQNIEYQQMLKKEGTQIESWAPFAEGRNNLFTNPTLVAIAEAHGKSVAQIVLRWLIQRNVIVIPKSVQPERMAQNFNVFDFTLSDEETKQIASLETGESQFFDHADPEMVRRLSSRTIS